ncbi:hypothetical protein [Tsuneonella sp. HG222]
MRQSISDVLAGYLRSGGAFHLQVVFTGKVKPLPFTLYDVFKDGLRMCALTEEGAATQVYPLTGIQSIFVEWLETA